MQIHIEVVIITLLLLLYYCYCTTLLLLYYCYCSSTFKYEDDCNSSNVIYRLAIMYATEISELKLFLNTEK